MDYCRTVDDKVFSSKPLVHTADLLFLFDTPLENDWVDYRNHLVIQVTHYESTDSGNCEVKVVNRVSFLVEIHLVGEQRTLQARADPS